MDKKHECLNDSFFEPSDHDPLREMEQESAEMAWLREAFPMLRDVRFEVVADEAFEGGVIHIPDSPGEPVVIRIGAGGAERFARLKQSREWSIRVTAANLGVSFEEIDGETIRQFVLFHEAGHAYDFLQNFAIADSGASPEDAVEMWRVSTEQEFDSLPFPGFAPAELREEIVAAGGFDTWRAEKPVRQAWCDAKKVSSEEQLFQMQETAYRKLDKESFADRFAVKAFAKFKARGNIDR